jgi:hypothetical protein
MNVRCYAPLIIAITATTVITPAALAQWADMAPQGQQAGTSDQTFQTAQEAQTAQQAARQLPNINLLMKAAMVKFDPQRETPQAYLARMKYIEEQMRIYQDRKSEAQAETPATKLPEGMVLPGMSAYQAKSAFTDNPYDKGFFGGITPQQAQAGLQLDLPSKKPLNPSPEWAKQKLPVHQYVDGVEHFGNEDSMGFIK